MTVTRQDGFNRIDTMILRNRDLGLCRKYICGVFLATMLLLYGCAEERTEGAFHKIQVDVGSMVDEQVSIYDIFSKVELVALDNEYPVGNIVYTGASNIAWDGSRFYILDVVTFGINVYGLDGTLLNHSDKVGRGPGEFSMADQIYYNKDLDLIEVLNPMGRIFRYTPGSLKFVSEVNYMGKGLLATHDYIQRGDNYILYSSSIDDQLWGLDTETGNLDKYDYRSPEHLRRYISPQAPFFDIGGRPCFFRPYDGLVYTFDMNTHRVVPFIEWDLGKHQCHIEDIPEDMTVHASYDFIVENSRKIASPYINIKAAGNTVFASVIYGGGKEYTLYHDLDTGETHFFHMTEEGMEFLPEIFDPEGKRMFKFIDFKYLPEYINRDILDEQSRAAYDKVIEEEGNAIAIYHL